MIGQAASRLLALLDVGAKPSHWRLILRDWLRLDEPLRPDEDHLRAAMAWLCRAQDVTGTGGVSGGYFFISREPGVPSMRGRWRPPYPETTGYIIPTFLNYARRTGEDDCTRRAVRMGEWEMAVQLPSGAVRGGMGAQGSPVVFNTGQVMLGWMALHRETGGQAFMQAAARAADWLVSIQNADGSWSRHTYLDTAHVYHTRVAWPLLEAHAATGKTAYREAAIRNLRWALGHTGEDGWIRDVGFRPGEVPSTHTIAYTLRGLLESGQLLDDDTGREASAAAARAAQGILLAYERRKVTPYGASLPMPAAFVAGWKPAATYSCLTGNAQIALVWLRLYALDGDARFLNAALKLLDHVKASQSLTARNMGIRGGIAGSRPVWGRYAPFAYPNWAAKFFADALMLQEASVSELAGRRA